MIIDILHYIFFIPGPTPQWTQLADPTRGPVRSLPVPDLVAEAGGPSLWTQLAAALGPRAVRRGSRGEGGNKLGWGHIKVQDKAPTEAYKTKPQHTGRNSNPSVLEKPQHAGQSPNILSKPPAQVY